MDLNWQFGSYDNFCDSRMVITSILVSFNFLSFFCEDLHWIVTEDTDREILSVDLCDHGWKMAGASRRGLRDGNAGRVSVDG